MSVLAPPRPATPDYAAPRTSLPARRRRVDHGPSWLRLGLYALALLFGFSSLRPLFDSFDWWSAAAAAVVLPLLAIGGAKQVGRRHWQPPVAGLLVSLLVLTVAYAPAESWLGFIPTGDTLARWAELVQEGGLSIATQRMPATATEGIQFLLVILAVSAAATIGPALDRAPGAAALPILIVLDIPVAIRAGVAEPVWFVLAALAFLALLRIGRRRMPRRGIVLIAALVTVGSLVVPTLLPPVRTVTGSGGYGFGSGLNPLIDLGDDLRRNDPILALTYSSNADAGIYLRLATLDRFNGIAWAPDATIQPENTVDAFPAPPGLSADVLQTELEVDIRVGEVGGQWLPVPYPAQSIEGLTGDWSFEPDGLAVRSHTADARGQEYSVSFLDIAPDRAQLSSTQNSGLSEKYLELPELPAVITATAREVAGSGTTYERALALQDYFADGDFTYSIDAPVEQGYDGSGVQVIAEFLEQKSGYCVHFASSMAVMARALGIPARVVVGFQPGMRDSTGAGDVYTVMSSDLHAWPELFFPEIGWLRFEPTPGRGALPDYSFADAIDNPELPSTDDDEEPAAAPTTGPTTAPVDPIDDDVDAGATPGSTIGATPFLVLAIALGIVAVLLIPAGVRIGIRLRRLTRVRTAQDADAAWAEIRDTALDHEWVAPDSETPRQLGERLAIVVGAEAVAPLQSGVESAAYDRPGASTLTADDVTAVRAAIGDAAPFSVRLRAFLLPPSLLVRLGFVSESRGDR